MSSYQNFLNDFKTAATAANRDIEEINLIAVSKKKSSEDIKKIIDLKHVSYGENQIQEVEKKWIDLKNKFTGLKLHFIGGVQSRKVKSIYHHCDVIHSLDREKIVKSFSECEAAFGISKEYFIQINTGDELQKSGVMLSEAEQFISSCIENYKLNIIGLMCIPPFNEDPQKHFLNLADIAKNFDLPSLSMGMSNDFEVALKCGATHIRIGTKIFGERN
jgi:pyridoxal phosphate enzyme (YggS family)